MRVEDLQVYTKLCDLAIEISKVSLEFPKFEVYELGSQIRRSSNSIPANLAEGFGNKHTNIYSETISRAQGELRETIHHLRIANKKGYISMKQFEEYQKRYEECSKMLYGLEKAILSRPSK